MRRKYDLVSEFARHLSKQIHERACVDHIFMLERIVEQQSTPTRPEPPRDCRASARGCCCRLRDRNCCGHRFAVRGVEGKLKRPRQAFVADMLFCSAPSERRTSLIAAACSVIAAEMSESSTSTFGAGSGVAGLLA